ncbi:hypothetical protein [Limibacillus halophilus]|uniref:Uncharacterized protein n=1 Tax=Limibacillus halophilus TaxID=1579333 RepID=A0A839SU71_9PROT|nr:hypothetical protein [Limibacillus halophilus]MBB3064966.1 hypothetical protein [Limibacillus halophilus]
MTARNNEHKKGACVVPKGLRRVNDESDSYALLTEREQLLLDVLRRWLTGWETRNPHYWRAAWELLCRQVSASAARRVLSGMESFVRAIAVDARRTLAFNRPCCGRVTSDERLLIDIMLRPRSAALLSAVSGIVEAGAMDETLRLGAEIASAVSSEVGEGLGGDLGVPNSSKGSSLNLTLH